MVPWKFHSNPGSQRRLAVVTATLTGASNDLLHFGVVLAVVCLAFCASAEILFGKEVVGFISLPGLSKWAYPSQLDMLRVIRQFVHARNKNTTCFVNWAYSATYNAGYAWACPAHVSLSGHRCQLIQPLPGLIRQKVWLKMTISSSKVALSDRWAYLA